MKFRIITYLLFVIAFNRVSAQDMHFTQFNLLPQLYNPGRIGLFDANLRASAHYRKQWASAGKGYGTQGAQVEGALVGSGPSGDRLGVGLIVLSDQAGKAQLKSLLIKTGLAYHIEMSGKDRMSLGMQLGYIQRSIGIDGLAWDAQYNGTEYDPSLPSQENPYANTVDRGIDLGAGMNWSHKSRESEWYAGYGFRHLGQNQTALINGADRLPIRQTVQAGAMTRLPFVWLYTDMLLQRQKGAMEIAASLRAEYRFGSDSRYTDIYKSSAIQTGVYYRYADAISPMIGFEWKRVMAISMSYDIPLSKVRRIVGLSGGPEITLVYNGDYGPKRKVAK